MSWSISTEKHPSKLAWAFLCLALNLCHVSQVERTGKYQTAVVSCSVGSDSNIQSPVSEINWTPEPDRPLREEIVLSEEKGVKRGA